MPRTTPSPTPSRPKSAKRPAKRRTPKAATLPTNVVPFPCPPGTGDRLAAAALAAEPKQRWYQTTDQSMHSYIVPVERRDEFEEWAMLSESDERSWVVPDYAIRCDGDLLEFSEPTLDDVPVEEIVARGRDGRGGVA